MACCGQFSTQVWQFMHSDMFTGSALPPSSLNTDCGQTFTHVPSPSHLFLSIVTMYMAAHSSPRRRACALPDHLQFTASRAARASIYIYMSSSLQPVDAPSVYDIALA